MMMSPKEKYKMVALFMKSTWSPHGLRRGSFGSWILKTLFFFSSWTSTNLKWRQIFEWEWFHFFWLILVNSKLYTVFYRNITNAQTVRSASNFGWHLPPPGFVEKVSHSGSIFVKKYIVQEKNLIFEINSMADSGKILFSFPVFETLITVQYSTFSQGSKS